jgi:hypothetical protein
VCLNTTIRRCCIFGFSVQCAFRVISFNSRIMGVESECYCILLIFETTFIIICYKEMRVGLDKIKLGFRQTFGPWFGLLILKFSCIRI